MTANWGLEKQNKTTGTADVEEHPRELDITVTQKLWNFGSTNAAINSAKLSVVRAKTNLVSTRQALVLQGIEARTHDPDVAWDMFTQFPVDLILSDWTHDLDGIAFLLRVRQDKISLNPFIPIVVCTANTQYDQVRHAGDLGATEFLAKPVTAKAIYSRICSIIENRRSFIRISNFFGPDRRRRTDGSY